MHDISPQLEGGSQFARGERQVLVQYNPFSDVLGTTDCGLVITVDRVSDDFVEARIFLRLGYGCGFDADIVEIFNARGGESVRGLSCQWVEHRLEGENAGEELALVSNHNTVGQHRAELEDFVLDGDRRNVLSTSRDNQLLQAAGDGNKSVWIHLGLVACVNPTFVIDGGSCLVGHLEVAHHIVATTVKEFGCIGIDATLNSRETATGRVEFPCLVEMCVGGDRTGSLALTVEIEERDIERREESHGFLRNGSSTSNHHTSSRE